MLLFILKRKIFSCLLILIFNSDILFSIDNNNLTGYWKGYILMFDEDSNKYNTIDIELKIIQKGNTVTGTSFDYILNDQSYCINNLIGSINKNKLNLNAVSIHIQKNSNNFTHFLFNLNLNISTNKLEGLILLNLDDFNNPYENKPFKIYLTKQNNNYNDKDKYNYKIPNTLNLLQYLTLDSTINKNMALLLKSNKKNNKKISSKNIKNIKIDTFAIKKRKSIITDSNNSIFNYMNNKKNINNDSLNVIIKSIKLDSNNKKNSKTLKVIDTISKRNIKKSKDTNENYVIYLNSAIKIDDKLVDSIYKLKKTNIKINTLLKNKQLKNINNNLYQLEFLYEDVYLYIYSIENIGDTITIFYNKKLAIPDLVLTKNPKIFELNFKKNDKIELDFFSNKLIKYKIIFKSFYLNSEYHLNLNNIELNYTKVKMYYNYLD